MREIIIFACLNVIVFLSFILFKSEFITEHMILIITNILILTYMDLSTTIFNNKDAIIVDKSVYVVALIVYILTFFIVMDIPVYLLSKHFLMINSTSYYQLMYMILFFKLTILINIFNKTVKIRENKYE